MYIKIKLIEEFENLDKIIDDSYNGSCFCYKLFLKLKEVNKLLAVYDSEKLIAVMPLFIKSNNIIEQSTMYVPYGGSVFIDNNYSKTKQFKTKRAALNLIAKYIKENYIEASFSLDTSLFDIMPFVRNSLVPEVRYTYKIDLNKSLDEIKTNFGSDRKKDLKIANKSKLIVIYDIDRFDFKEALKWEKNYGSDSSIEFVKEYISKSIEVKTGKVFLAKYNEHIIGGVAIVWDKKSAYIMYSYYDPNYDLGAISFLYYEIIKYLKSNDICNYLDFEGSVFESIENFNASFGADQYVYFNIYWEKDNKIQLFSELYDYGEK